MTKIITYNVNGIRSAINKGFLQWLKASNPDILCLQEIKCTADQIPLSAFRELGYEYPFICPAQKKGYSGVATFSKYLPVSAEVGCGMEKYDCEGRLVRLDFETFSVLNVYMPSGSSGETRQAFKMIWLDDFFIYINNLKKQKANLILCGDFNICHQSIDIHNPKSNAKSSGFLPEERLWMSKFLESGFVDVIRYFNQEPHHYTWWSYRSNSRTKNLGWRIDYHMISKDLENRLKRGIILPDAKHSDHCPVLLEIEDYPN